MKVFGKEAPDEEVQREIDSQRSPEPVDEVRVSSIRNVPLYYPNKRKSETKHMLQNKRPERELCGVISTRGVACKQVAVNCRDWFLVADVCAAGQRDLPISPEKPLKGV